MESNTAGSPKDGVLGDFLVTTTSTDTASDTASTTYQEFCGDLVQLHRFVHYISYIVSIVLTLCTHISFRSKDEFQIRKYHEKEQLLANRMVPNEAQYTKTPLVIFTVKEDNHLQYISNGHFDNSNRFIHIS